MFTAHGRVYKVGYEEYGINVTLTNLSCCETHASNDAHKALGAIVEAYTYNLAWDKWAYTLDKVELTK